jgi:putative ABC transport system permease protein
MSPSLYSKLYGEDVAANQLLCKLSDKSKSTEDSLSAKLMNQPGVSSVSFTTGLKDTFSKMIVALRYVVLVLIASAAALAFVVLFSLTSINIDERRRELATIKVLGFFNSELAAYTYRENILLTLFGTVFGLILGVVLERFVINTSEVEMVMFSRDLLWQSYVYSAGFTFIFAAIVNLIMLPHLKKIDMVSSLKSVE